MKVEMGCVLGEERQGGMVELPGGLSGSRDWSRCLQEPFLASHTPVAPKLFSTVILLVMT